MHAREMCLSHVVHCPRVSTAIAVIIRIICKSTWCPNRLLKMLKWTTHCYKACLKLPTYSLDVSLLALLKPDKIQILKNKIGCNVYVVNMHPVFSTDVCAFLVILSSVLMMTTTAIENLSVRNKMWTLQFTYIDLLVVLCTLSPHLMHGYGKC
jgi:hypothetical protein